MVTEPGPWQLFYISCNQMRLSGFQAHLNTYIVDHKDSGIVYTAHSRSLMRPDSRLSPEIVKIIDTILNGRDQSLTGINRSVNITIQFSLHRYVSV